MLADIAYAMAPAGEGGGQQSPFAFLIFMGLLFAIFYFILLRPQYKRQKEHRQLLENLKKGDKVITSGGIYGTIVAVSDQVVTLEIADKGRIKEGKNYIAGLIKSQ